MTVDECIEIAERECEGSSGSCPIVADCDLAGFCIEGWMAGNGSNPWPYDDHPADDPR